MSRPQAFIKKLNSNFFHITVIVFSQYSQIIQCFSSRSMTFTQFNYDASPWRHLALLLTALALTAQLCAVVTSWRERLARRYARPWNPAKGNPDFVYSLHAARWYLAAQSNTFLGFFGNTVNVYNVPKWLLLSPVCYDFQSWKRLQLLCLFYVLYLQYVLWSVHPHSSLFRRHKLFYCIPPSLIHI